MHGRQQEIASPAQQLRHHRRCSEVTNKMSQAIDAVNKLKQSVRLAFKDEGIPNDIRRQMYDALAIGGGDDELASVLYRFNVEAWSQIPNQVIKATYPDTLLLSGDIFQYFLPAFMIAVLDEEVGGEFVLGLVNKVCVVSSKQRPAQVGLDIQRLTQEQLRCITLFLKWCRDNCFEGQTNIQHRIDRATAVIMQETDK